jgi:uncharacterized cofD-like protein
VNGRTRTQTEVANKRLEVTGKNPIPEKIEANAGRVVAVGGGTGLSSVLRGLKQYVAPPLYVAPSPRDGSRDGGEYPISDLAAIVTVTDDGGSSGRLRREYSILPPGDIRNCLVALADDEARLSRLFQYRFPSGKGLGGHSFGNLFLTALSHVTGDFAEAVRVSGQVLAIRGRIYPATVQNVSLEALMYGGRVVRGETRIAKVRGRIRRLSLIPRRVKPLPDVMNAIENAGVILLGPGSLYTSVIPNLLVAGVAEAIARSKAVRVYISNLMTQPGETDKMTVADHVHAIYKHTKRPLFDCVVINHQAVSPEVARRYSAEGAEQVVADISELEKLGLRCVDGNLLEEHAVVRHDSARLAKMLVEEFVITQRRK